MQIKLGKIISVCHPNGFLGNEHTHPHNEMVYCFEGSGEVSIRGEKSKFSAGNYYLTHRHTPHAEKDDQACRIIYFFFDAPPEMICEGAYTDYSGNIGSIIRRLYAESDRDLPKKEEMIRLLITQLLIEAERAAARRSERRDFFKILQYVKENLEHPIDFKTLAAQYHYSYDRFRHIFKDLTGCSPHQYVLHQRIEKARFLLSLNPSTSLTEIAFDCGFTSSSQFSNIFLTKTGMTPSQYQHLCADTAQKPF